MRNLFKVSNKDTEIKLRMQFQYIDTQLYIEQITLVSFPTSATQYFVCSS